MKVEHILDGILIIDLNSATFKFHCRGKVSRVWRPLIFDDANFSRNFSPFQSIFQTCFVERFEDNLGQSRIVERWAFGYPMRFSETIETVRIGHDEGDEVVGQTIADHADIVDVEAILEGWFNLYLMKYLVILKFYDI